MDDHHACTLRLLQCTTAVKANSCNTLWHCCCSCRSAEPIATTLAMLVECLVRVLSHLYEYLYKYAHHHFNQPTPPLASEVKQAALSVFAAHSGWFHMCRSAYPPAQITPKDRESDPRSTMPPRNSIKLALLLGERAFPGIQIRTKTNESTLMTVLTGDWLQQLIAVILSEHSKQELHARITYCYRFKACAVAVAVVTSPGMEFSHPFRTVENRKQSRKKKQSRKQSRQSRSAQHDAPCWSTVLG
jgi:hypothetical protein